MHFVDNLQTAAYDAPTRPRNLVETARMPTEMTQRPSEATLAIEMLREHSLATLAQQELERRIISGEISAGTKLNETDVAGALGVSRGPVREAFRMLEEAGLLRQEKNRGVFVRQIPLAEALEIFELRAMMDEAAGRALAPAVTPEQLRELRARVDAMERAVKAADANAYHLLNLDFHDTLVAMTGKRKLTALYRRLINQLSLFRRMNLADAAQLPASASEHRAIVKAIAAGDGDAAGRLMREHALRSMERVRRRQATPAALPGNTRNRKNTHA